MPRSAAPTRQRLRTVAYGLFYKAGFSRVSMDDIARGAGVTKRTLYNHFDSKDALTAAVLEHQQGHAMARIRQWNQPPAGDPVDFVTTLFEDLACWASDPRWLGSGYTRLTMELADLPGHPARRAAHRHKAAVEDWLAAEIDALGVRQPRETARQLMLLIEGCLSLILIHGDPSYAASAARAATRLVGDGERA